jgi:hypothetical protein
MPVKCNTIVPFGITKKFYLDFLRKGGTEVIFYLIVCTEKDYVIDVDGHVDRRFTWN